MIVTPRRIVALFRFKVYVHDLSSTRQSFMRANLLPPGTVQVSSRVRFGRSMRMFCKSRSGNFQSYRLVGYVCVNALLFHRHNKCATSVNTLNRNLLVGKVVLLIVHVEVNTGVHCACFCFILVDSNFRFYSTYILASGSTGISLSVELVRTMSNVLTLVTNNANVF